MTMIYDKNSKKKATNLTINSDLLQKAKKLKINISNCLEKSLEQQVIKKEREKWEEKNKQSLIQYNNRIQNNGLFSDGLRSF
ncbi:MAG: type II toxin-antitoxin system CcdA family antitoxin [Campylobacterota bacterium]|nr:type II toxin-antitoxin system CcdA family antitoxin [Campylobacterota bacterium]